MNPDQPLKIGRREAIIKLGATALPALLLPHFFLKRHLWSILPEQYPAQIISVGSGAGRILNQVVTRIRGPFRSLSLHADLEGYQNSLAEIKIFERLGRHELSAECCPHPELGKEACEKNRSRVIKLLKRGKANIIIACLGGDFGTGAGPLIAAWSQELGLPTYAIVTLPFVFELWKSNEVAQMAEEEFHRQTISTYAYSNNEPMLHPSLGEFLKAHNYRIPGKEVIGKSNRKLAEICINLLQNLLAPGTQISWRSV
jgi:hypothetical protein